MCANIEAIRDDVDAINRDEISLGVVLYDLSFAAEYGHGSTSKAIESIHASRQHADRAVVAAAAGNALMAAKHEAQAAAAEADAVHMLERAEGYANDLRGGLDTAAEIAGSALGRARSLVKVDDSSPAAEIHTKIAAQPEALRAMAQRAEEIHLRVPGSRDPAELRVAAEHFIALRYELEEGSGRAQEIASDSLGYGNQI
jgi:hypothetical protein